MKKGSKKNKPKAASKPARKHLKTLKKAPVKARGKGAQLSPKASKKATKIAEAKPLKGAKPAVLKGKLPAKGAPAVVGKPLTKQDKKAEIIAELVAAQKVEAEVVLTNAEGKQYCRVHDCDNEATTDGHCRFHYLALWKRNKIKAKILQGGKLDKYIEDLTAKYPDKYLEMLRKDLASEKDFNLIIAEMDVEDAGEEAESEEDANRFIEEVRGGMPTPDDDESSF